MERVSREEKVRKECLVPECWWIEKNEGMLKTEDGDWVMANLEDEDYPIVKLD